jgi:hypothetical protein
MQGTVAQYASITAGMAWHAVLCCVARRLAAQTMLCMLLCFHVNQASLTLAAACLDRAALLPAPLGALLPPLAPAPDAAAAPVLALLDAGPCAEPLPVAPAAAVAPLPTPSPLIAAFRDPSTGCVAARIRFLPPPAAALCCCSGWGSSSSSKSESMNSSSAGVSRAAACVDPAIAAAAAAAAARPLLRRLLGCAGVSSASSSDSDTKSTTSAAVTLLFRRPRCFMEVIRSLAVCCERAAAVAVPGAAVSGTTVA